MRRTGFALLIGALVALGAASARGETGQVRIGLQFGLTYLPIVVAESERLFDKHARQLGLPALEVSLHRFSGSTAMNEALLSNSIDFGAYGLPGLLIAWEKTRAHQQIKGLASLAAINYVLYTNRPDVKALEDFGDQDKIAVPASNSPQAILLRAAAEQRFGAGQYQRIDRLLVSLPHPDATSALLGGKAVTGYFATPPFSQFLAHDTRVHAVLTSRDILAGVDATAAALGGPQAFVEKNPKVARAILAGLEEAMALIGADPARAADIYVKSEQVRFTREQVEQFIRDGSTLYNVAPRGLMTYAGFMAQQGMLKSAPGSWKDVFFPLVHDREGD